MKGSMLRTLGVAERCAASPAGGEAGCPVDAGVRRRTVNRVDGH